MAKHIANTGAQETSVFTMFFLQGSQKKRENTTFLTIFGHHETEKKLQR